MVSDWYPLGRYLLLAQTNFDHFSQDAVIAYTAGHAVALGMAVAASQQAGNAAQNAALQVAYAANAFADHFLSDLFSSGHMRAPRKQLYRGVTPSDLGSLLARAMHDEDSHFGLMVTPANGGAPWRAYGDKRYFDSVDLTNLNLVDGAVQLSADEVWEAFSTGQTLQPANFAALGFIANLTTVQQFGANIATNFSPMFALGNGGTVVRRTNLNDLNDQSWINDWFGFSTYALLKSYQPNAPAGAVQPPASAVGVTGWTQQQQVPPNWVNGNSVRYAVSFGNGQFESDFGPWSNWFSIQNEAFPLLGAVPTDPTGVATARYIWRQFTGSSPTLAGIINDNTTTTFNDLVS